MDEAVYFAKLLAVIYLCAGLGAIMNKKHLQRVLEDFTKNTGLDYLGALVSLILGFIMVSFYNTWQWNWTLLITLMGWGAVLKGAVHLLFPEFTMKMMKLFLKKKWVGMIGPVCLLLGLVFGYFGFVLILPPL